MTMHLIKIPVFTHVSCVTKFSSGSGCMTFSLLVHGWSYDRSYVYIHIRIACKIKHIYEYCTHVVIVYRR